jgi:hypothetical protein
MTTTHRAEALSIALLGLDAHLIYIEATADPGPSRFELVGIPGRPTTCNASVVRVVGPGTRSSSLSPRPGLMISISSSNRSRPWPGASTPRGAI